MTVGLGGADGVSPPEPESPEEPESVDWSEELLFEPELPELPQAANDAARRRPARTDPPTRTRDREVRLLTISVPPSRETDERPTPRDSQRP